MFWRCESKSNRAAVVPAPAGLALILAMHGVLPPQSRAKSCSRHGAVCCAYILPHDSPSFEGTLVGSCTTLKLQGLRLYAQPAKRIR